MLILLSILVDVTKLPHAPPLEGGVLLMQRKITKASVEAAIRDAQKRGAKVYLWDTELRGFGFYASPRGNASWLAQKWKGGKAASGGRPVRWVIGQYRMCSPRMG